MPFIISQIHDNFEKGNLEEGNYDLLDVTDYHNLGLIVSSSKSIYTGIPPIKKTETNAALFKFSHLITINTNYLLVACLEDSFLGKINLFNGSYVPLLSYSQLEDTLNSSDTLGLPDAICSLSNIDNTIYYIAGDTDYSLEASMVKCDVAMLPIGGTYTMDPEEAAKLANVIHPKYAVPTHYGSIVGSPEDADIFISLVDKEIECIKLIHF